MRPLNIGISVLARADTHLWSNGLNQNVAFLAMLLRRLPGVGQLWLLNGGDATQLPETLDFRPLGVPLVAPGEVTHEIDVVIQMGAVLPPEWMSHVHALGARTVAFLAGHTYAALAESPIFGRPDATIFNSAPFDEVWSLPHHMASCAPLLRTATRAPVLEVPHLWAPDFLERSAARVRAAGGASFGFEVSRARAAGGWNLGIFEPNISVVKSCFVPMLAGDHAYRREPGAVAAMRVLNTLHMKDHLTFNRFAANLDLTRDGRASYEPRLMFAEAMSTFAIDAVIAHQWECGLNYAYYDALHGGYPLVHNSDALAAHGVGLHYPGFGAREAGERLVQAWRQPAPYWQDYRCRAEAFLRTLSPAAEPNLAAFAARLGLAGADRAPVARRAEAALA